MEDRIPRLYSIVAHHPLRTVAASIAMSLIALAAAVNDARAFSPGYLCANACALPPPPTPPRDSVLCYGDPGYFDPDAWTCLRKN